MDWGEELKVIIIKRKVLYKIIMIVYNELRGKFNLIFYKFKKYFKMLWIIIKIICVKIRGV